jgi:hypothetical protein
VTENWRDPAYADDGADEQPPHPGRIRRLFARLGLAATWIGALPGRIVASVAGVRRSQPWPVPETDADDWDYGRMEHDLGLTERKGGALVLGLASLVVVVLIGAWFVFSLNHGPTEAPIHLHFPIPGPPGPQGSPVP